VRKQIRIRISTLTAAPKCVENNKLNDWLEREVRIDEIHRLSPYD
jgi:hypothetical protein